VFSFSLQLNIDRCSRITPIAKQIVNAPPPKTVQQLRSFLGLLNYYSKFVRNLASMIHRLNRLLQHNVRWKWSTECINAFKSAKKELVSSKLLAHYDPELPIKMAADVSAYGVGAVNSHVYPDGHEKPVAFASRTLSKSEYNYAQLEKEALALIFGVKQFHQYLYARRFTLVTDHHPLTTILHPQKGIPSLVGYNVGQSYSLLTSMTSLSSPPSSMAMLIAFLGCHYLLTQ